jgi:hypothetical protein
VEDLAGQQAAGLEGPTFAETTTTVRREQRVPQQLAASNA